MKYYFSKELNASFDEAKQKVLAALKQEGFGVISEIDIQQKLKEKLGESMKKYVILGACSPQHAFKALQIDPHLGVLLPCNVVVREVENNLIEVSAVNPLVSMNVVENDKLNEIADHVNNKLSWVIDNL